MSNNVAIKKNISSMQVLKTLQVLLEDNYTMSEIVERLNINEEESIFNNSVVSKYINTCRFCGIDIPKIQNRYFVASMPFGLNISARDLELIEILQKAANSLPKKPRTSFNNLIQKISRFSNKNIYKVKKSCFDITRERFDNAIENKVYIRLMYRTKDIIECIPLSIENIKGKFYFNVFYKNKEKLISIDRISGLEVTKEKISSFNTKNTTVFKLKGDLALRYSARENETILTETLPDYIAVSNKDDNKELLLHRLLRYDSLCEVAAPQVCRDEMKDLINKTLANYGE